MAWRIPTRATRHAKRLKRRARAEAGGRKIPMPASGVVRGAHSTHDIPATCFILQGCSVYALHARPISTRKELHQALASSGPDESAGEVNSRKAGTIR